jgi:hypothetical protein
MSVILSPLGGAASQFFTNTGAVLTGGKLYTYAAGTTTPRTTYTSSSGTIFSANPIILDASGRVPGGEIWLINGLSYKFVVQDSAGSTIGTYDNITGLFNAQNLQNVRATGNGTSNGFVMPSLPISINQSNIYINGVYQNKNTYVLSGTQFIFTEAPPLNSIIEFNYY